MYKGGGAGGADSREIPRGTPRSLRETQDEDVFHQLPAALHGACDHTLPWGQPGVDSQGESRAEYHVRVHIVLVRLHLF